MPARTVTGSMESDTEPGAILQVLMDPTQIPRWAPLFADAIEVNPHGGWKASKDGSVFNLKVVTAQPSRTVDYLREVAPGKEGGAYLRVLDRPGGGSVVLMTLPIPAGVAAETVDRILGEELSNLVSLGSQG